MVFVCFDMAFTTESVVSVRKKKQAFSWPKNCRRKRSIKVYFEALWKSRVRFQAIITSRNCEIDNN